MHTTNARLTAPTVRRCYDESVDVDTSNALDHLGRRIDSLDVSLGGRIDRVDRRIDAVDQSLNARMDLLEQSLNGRMDSLEESLRGEMAQVREEVRESRRYAQVLNEATRDDVQLVAEAVAALSIKVDSLGERLR